jgi:hypothetical protein
MATSADAIAAGILNGDPALPSDLAATVAAWPTACREMLQVLLLPDAVGRRWLRRAQLPELTADDASELARQLRRYPEDFDVNHRDSTTAQLIRALSFSDLRRDVAFFAGSNAAGAMWRRLAAERPDQIAELALEVLREGEVTARATTLYLLLLDPFSEMRLHGAERVDLLLSALDDPSEEVRGLVADALAEEAPEQLAARLPVMTRDASERVRTAAWDAAFATELAAARDAALALLVDEDASLDARRTALVALSAALTTLEIAPILEAIVVHPERALAEVAADLLWSYHRSPSIALAASVSPHESVREAARRLLNPQTGSPAAGGSRPGAPERAHDIYHAMMKGYERPKE